MSTAAVIALMIALAPAQQPETDDAFLFLGQSTCLGFDAEGAADNTTNNLGNKRPKFEVMYRYSGIPLPERGLWPLEGLTDQVNCGYGKAVAPLTGCDTWGAGAMGPGRSALEYWTRSTGRTATRFVSAASGIPLNTTYWLSKGPYWRYARAATEQWGPRSVDATHPRGRPMYVITCQGEADANNPYATYLTNVQTWQQEMEALIKATVPYHRDDAVVPMFSMQYASCSANGGHQASSACGSMQSLVDAAKGPARGKIIITGPAYQYIHNSVHPSGYGACGYSGNGLRGVVAMEAVRSWVTTGSWKTLWWENVERLSSTGIRVTYQIQQPPLVFDTGEQYPGIPATAMTEPTVLGGMKGFHVLGATGPAWLAVSAVQLCTGAGAPHVSCQQADQIIVTHAAEAGAATLYYGGLSDSAGANPGPVDGMRGNVRDSACYMMTPERACGAQCGRNFAITEYKALGGPP